MVRERWPELLRSSGANHLALRSLEGVFLAFIVLKSCLELKKMPSRFWRNGFALA
jgi:hypothetical protein